MKIINTLIKKLSQITIDGDKDWGGNRITNVGTPTATGDVLRKGTRQTMAEVPDGTLNQVIKGGGAGANPGYGMVGHGELGGVTSDQHHSRSHDHSLAADGSPIAISGVPDLPASKVTTGRFGMARMPEGTSGYVLMAQGPGADPVYEAVAAGATIGEKALIYAGL